MLLIARIVLSALVLIGITRLIPGITVENFYTAVIVAVILGILNAVVRPILIVLTLPVTILTLGLFVFVINAGIFLFVASFVDGFIVNGFLPALVGSLLMSVAGTVFNKLLG